MAKLKREQLTEHLIEYQLNMIGLTTLDALFTKDWYSVWTLSPEQFEIWEKYCIATIKKTLKINTNKAKKAFDWLNLGYGLKIKENDKGSRIFPRTSVSSSRKRISRKKGT